MRRLVSNANNALRSMAGAEKMMASCDLLRIEKIRVVIVEAFSFRVISVATTV
jgi:hypothetical protein